MKNSFFQVRPSYVIKTVVYTLYAIFLICITSATLPSLGYNGAAPDLIICAVISLSYFESEKAASGFGMLAGFALEAVGSTGFSILPLFYMLCGCVSWLLFSRALQKNFGAYMLYTALFMIVRTFISVIYIQLSAPNFALDLAFKNTLLPEYVLTVCSAAFVFALTFFISKKLSAHKDMAQVKM